MVRPIHDSRQALKTLSRMPVNVSTLVRDKINQYAADLASLANRVVTLRGEPGILRLRVGGWRVVFSEDGDVIAIIRIASRGSVYE